MNHTAAPATLDFETPTSGLTEAEVSERTRAGKANVVDTSTGRTVPQIVKANVFTRINAIYGVLFALVMSTGYFLDGMFGLLIVVNSSVGIVQEIRAKRTLDRLAIVNRAHPRVRRQGKLQEVPPEQVVLDDLLEVSSGDQVAVDGMVTHAQALEVDESMLTGESDPVVKAPGDALLSGSFVVSGHGTFQATAVGPDAYAAKLAKEASRFSLVKSELRAGIDRILKVVTWLLFPVGALVIHNQLSGGQEWNQALRGMVAALVPMVPEGLVLMTSVAMMVGIVRLGKRNCLVNELPAIEGLARVDVVCADKTGTLTENSMRVSQVVPLQGRDDLEEALAAFAAAEPHPNASLLAVGERYSRDPHWETIGYAPFNSAKKWSGISFSGRGNWVLGAPDVLLDPDHPAARQAQDIGAQGLRVLLFGTGDEPVESPRAPGAVAPAALVVLEQKVRPDAQETIDFFHGQGVDVKVISGDNAVSVGAVAHTLGLGVGKEPVDARDLPAMDTGDFTDRIAAGDVFGRVSPEQKRAMVGALQSKGHTVAMTGDGVNDVLALKDADIGVAMGAGSPATRAVGQIVLLDNKFATLPHVVGEGRRVIGNIERVSNLFLTKTIYSILLALLVGLTQVPFPLVPRHITIVAWFTIGIPAFLLSLAPNSERARSGFVTRVLRLAVPSGLAIGASSFLSYYLTGPSAGATEAQATVSSTATLITMITGALWVLAVVARPYAWWKVALVGAMALANALLFALPWTQGIFLLDITDSAMVLRSLALGAVAAAVVEAAWWVGRANVSKQPTSVADTPTTR